VGSADLMPRNLNRRVEVLFPIQSRRLVRRVRDEILQQYLIDDTRARCMRSDGSYTPKPRNGRHDSQAWFLAQRAAPSNVIGLAHDQGMKPGYAAEVSTPTETLQQSAARLIAEIDSIRERLGSQLRSAG